MLVQHSLAELVAFAEGNGVHPGSFESKAEGSYA